METQIKTHQQLMDSAYGKWQNEWKGKSREDFYFALSNIEREAVVLGNFNYQVCNGGFSQWNFNGYMELHIKQLKNILRKINTILSAKVLSLVEKYEMVAEDDGEDFDSEYYKINEKFMEDCEVYLKNLQEAE